MVGFRVGKISPRHEVEFFVKHAALSLVDSINIPERSVLVGFSSNGGSLQTTAFRRTEFTRHYAKRLAEHYREGVSRPLPFFPKASLSFIKQSPQYDDKRRKILAKFANEFENADERSEFADPHVRRCFARAENVFGEEFVNLAKDLASPIAEGRI
jgi:exodeoxyribonuclease V gamma subunit